MRTGHAPYWAALAAAICTQTLAGEAPTRDVPLRVRVLEIDGIEWRSAVHERLRTIERQGVATAWATDAETVGRLIGWANREVPTPPDDGTASVRIAGETTRQYVASVSPVVSPNAVAFQPTIDQLSEGLELNLSGRRVESGVLIDLAAKDTQFIAFYTASVTLRPPGKPAFSGPPGAIRVGNEIAAQYQVPEFVTGSASGRWTIGRGEALVVGLGVRNVSSGRPGTDRLRERLIVIDAGDLSESAIQQGRLATRPTRPVTAFYTALTVGFLIVMFAVALGGAWLLGRASGRRAACDQLRPVTAPDPGSGTDSAQARWRDRDPLLTDSSWSSLSPA